jgi:hypothetical protein
MSTQIAKATSPPVVGAEAAPNEPQGPTPLAALTPAQRQLVLALIEASRVGAKTDLVLLKSEQRPAATAVEVHP